jgi:hypothetical protein
MRKLSLIALASFLFLWGLNLYVVRDEHFFIPKLSEGSKKKVKRVVASETPDSPINSELLVPENVRELDKIGDVINEENVKIGAAEKEQIKKEKVKFDNDQNLREKVTMLEQSFLDKHSSVRDIKRLQSEIQDLKNKMKIEIQNTEKWDPMFIYYLMISENYTYMEINTIRSLQENGISKDELNYINDLIRQEAFKQQVLSFKNSGNIDKVVANLGKKKAKEKDEFVGGDENAPSLEDKLIEMNYGQEQKDEMIYGHSIQ